MARPLPSALPLTSSPPAAPAARRAPCRAASPHRQCCALSHVRRRSHPMSLFDKLRGEFIDVIQWTQPSDCELLAYRFPRYGNEIKYGAQLTVREGQAAVFVTEGQAADAFPPGMYTLETKNLPILSTLKGWKYGFSSPFKAEVYFVATRQWTDQKWGTQNPFMLRDAEFGPVRIRAFGTYAFRVSDPGI